jgi:hypothetical protein
VGAILPQFNRSAVAQDKRFAGQAWQHWPFKAFYQNFLLTRQWWHNATTGVPGVSRHHEDIVSFLARQALDIDGLNMKGLRRDLAAAEARVLASDAGAAGDVELLVLSIRRRLRDRDAIRREAIAKYVLARAALDF